MTVTEILAHYSGLPIGDLQAIEQPTHPWFKPSGFWLSVEGQGDGWKEWCEDNDFNLGNLRCRARLSLHAAAKILRLGTLAEIRNFSREYRSPDARRHDYGSIDWRRVAASFQGIIIAPHVCEAHFDFAVLWYYCWDCASGCIWDPCAIASIEPDVAYRFSPLALSGGAAS
jgi:hypothetical protein